MKNLTLAKVFGFLAIVVLIAFSGVTVITVWFTIVKSAIAQNEEQIQAAYPQWTYKHYTEEDKRNFKPLDVFYIESKSCNMLLRYIVLENDTAKRTLRCRVRDVASELSDTITVIENLKYDFMP